MVTRPPIAFFAFNRLAHSTVALDALARCQGAGESHLTVFVDGPRSASEAAVCAQVAHAAAQARGFASVTVLRSAKNKGLFCSITEGVSSVLLASESVIVVEDDLVVTEDFLDYMSFFLDAYSQEPKVGCIHGYALPLEGLPDYFFLRGADCWGWATWRDRWQLFCVDARKVLAQLDQGGLLEEFMLSHGAASLELLCDRAQDRNQSWAILWHASLFLSERLTLHPGQSFVENIGNDGSGTHSAATERFRSAPRQAKHRVFTKLPVHADPVAASLTSSFMDGRPRRSLLDRWLVSLRRKHAKSRAVRISRARP